MMNKNKTYYNQHAQSFIDDTLNVAMDALYAPFLALLPQQAQQQDQLFYHRLRDQAPSRKIRLIYNPAHLSDQSAVIEVFRAKLVGF